jgi:hypothetical protein
MDILHLSNYTPADQCLQKFLDSIESKDYSDKVVQEFVKQFTQYCKSLDLNLNMVWASKENRKVNILNILNEKYKTTEFNYLKMELVNFYHIAPNEKDLEESVENKDLFEFYLEKMRN